MFDKLTSETIWAWNFLYREVLYNKFNKLDGYWTILIFYFILCLGWYVVFFQIICLLRPGGTIYCNKFARNGPLLPVWRSVEQQMHD